MKKIISVLALLCMAAGLNAQDFKIVGYMPSWSGAAADIQYSKLTHINYSFVTPNRNGTGALNAMPSASKLTSIVTLAHAANVKVFIAIGGYEMVGGVGYDAHWAALASSSTSITRFRNEAMALVWLYNLDGIDIDWEFPSNDTEAEGYVNLMTVLADTLHKSGKHLSTAVVAQGNTAGYIYDEVFDIVDWINIMAYDNCCSSHSSYGFGTNSLDYWVARGLAPSKAILGVPFYAKTANGTSSISYKNIIASNTAYSELDFYDNDSFVRYFYNGIPTIKSKTTYAKANGGGIMIWELSQDATGVYSLLSAINEIQPAIQQVTSVKATSSFSSSVYPNPAKDYTYVEAADVSVSSFQYELVDLSGKSMFGGVINGRSGQIPLSSLPQGMYVLHLKEGDKVSAIRIVKE